MSAAARDLAPRGGFARASRALASVKLTLVGFGTLAAGAMGAAYADVPASWPLAAPLLLLSVNLAAAILTNPVFRAERALLAFHIALFLLVALAAAGRLTYLTGRVEVATGSSFDGELTHVEAGPWHRDRLADAAFTNEGFEISYSPGLNRDETRNLVWWLEGEGVRRAVIGDRDVLERHGYRFSTSSNKGFAALVSWRDAGGRVHRGAVHMPSYPLYDHRQAQEWTPPAARAPLWLMLDFDEVLIDPAKGGRFRLPREHALVVRAGDARAVLKPGESAAIGGGVIAYEGLTSWMGYDVSYDWTRPWILACALAAVAALGLHFARRFAREPWDA